MRALSATLALLLLVSWVSLASAASSPRYHTVASGQNLGLIAKRYGVTVQAICNANGIDRKARLKVGQKLLVPAKSDKDGTLTRRQYGPPERNEAAGGKTVLASAKSEPARPTTHKVYAGQRLGSIARRYNVSIEALCDANRIRRTDPIKPGQVLIIPGTLPDGNLTKLTEPPDYRPDSTKKSKNVKKGFVDLSTYTARYRGVVFDKNGRVAKGAIESISRLFGATGNRPRVDARLIALLADVSEHFGGRPMRVVSGWRDHSYFEDSRHKHSQAVDFSIPGVPNTVVRDYVRRFRNCGVGYYPNSSFVHLDVRQSAAYWVDYAGPGEPPRNKPRPEPRSVVAQVGEPAPSTTTASAASTIRENAAQPDEPAPSAAPAPVSKPTAVDVTSRASASVPGPKPTPAPTPAPTL